MTRNIGDPTPEITEQIGEDGVGQGEGLLAPRIVLDHSKAKPGWVTHSVEAFEGAMPDDLGYLSDVPVLYLALAVIGVPLAAAGAGWLIAGREPTAIARRVIE